MSTVLTMRSRPTTPSTPLSPVGENPFVRHDRQMSAESSTDALCPRHDAKFSKKTISPPNLHRFISQNTASVIKCVVVISLALNIVSIPSLVGVLAGPLAHWACPLGSGYTDAVCLPCGRHGIPGVRVGRTNNGYCCVKSADPDFKTLVDKRLISVDGLMATDSKEKTLQSSRRRNMNRASKRTFNAARLILDVEATNHKSKLVWLARSQLGIAYITGGIQLTEGMLRVAQGGYYRIRSHFSFDTIQNNLNNNKRYHIITHSIAKLSVNAEELMMQKVMIENGQYRSSDLDLTVRLRANESVLVNVDTCKFLYNLAIANTLEIEKIW